ncbi:hypothetical protein D210916BOD24_24800 [Alteromonas sp. D210916BOD_24]|uniref:rhodanese-like domain-containing protein n=1 Tax=Alteromonas sp. D210916BOD_24 TaxID=3157618 RepID=UPI00399C93E5
MKIALPMMFAIAGIVMSISIPHSANANSQTSVAPSPHVVERVANKEWLLLDVRSTEEFAQGHIPGAMNIPFDEIDHYLAELDTHKGKPIIIYCRSGRRARIAMKVLADLNFPDVMHLEGDVEGWSEAGLPLERR